MPAFGVAPADSESLFISGLFSPIFLWFFYGALLIVGLVVLVVFGARGLSTMGHTARSDDLRLGWRPKDAADALIRRPISWRMAALVCLALLACQAACSLLFSLSNERAIILGAQRDSFLTVTNALAFHLVAILAAAVVIARSGLSWEDAFGVRRRALIRQAGQGIVCYVAALPVFTGVSIAYGILLESLGFEVSPQEVVNVLMTTLSTRLFALHLILAILVAPVAEEILFRGMALPLVAKKWGMGPAVAAVSVLFAAVHLHLPSFLPLLVLGIALSVAYVFTGNIAAPMVMHMMFNGVNIVFLLTFSP